MKVEDAQSLWLVLDSLLASNWKNKISIYQYYIIYWRKTERRYVLYQEQKSVFGMAVASKYWTIVTISTGERPISSSWGVQ